MFGIGGHDVNPDNYDEWGRKGGWTSSLGQGWANVANTPFRRYKRENHEGGTSSPLIIWSGRKSGLGIIPGSLTHQVAHIIDILPTLADLGGALVPNHLHGVKQKTKEGRSLVPHLKGASPTPRTLYWEHEGHRAVRSGDMKLVALSGQPWELYDLSKDRSETVDLAGRQPQTVKRLESTWNAWATRVGVRPWNEVAEAMKTMRRKARGKK